MRRLFLCVGLGLAVASLALAQTEPSWFQPGPGDAPMAPNPEACWSEPPDLEGYLISSEVLDEWGVVTEVADDFIMDSDRTIAKVRWWGGYFYMSTPCEPGMAPPGFYLRFYEDNLECLPSHGWYAAYAEFFIPGLAAETFVGCSTGGFPLYQYEAAVNVVTAGSARYWFSAQMAGHLFPPQWGRLATGAVSGCESAFWQQYGPGYWTPISDVIGESIDMSQELECDEPVAVQHRSWGAIKRLYR